MLYELEWELLAKDLVEGVEPRPKIGVDVLTKSPIISRGNGIHTDAEDPHCFHSNRFLEMVMVMVMLLVMVVLEMEMTSYMLLTE